MGQEASAWVLVYVAAFGFGDFVAGEIVAWGRDMVVLYYGALGLAG